MTRKKARKQQIQRKRQQRKKDVELKKRLRQKMQSKGDKFKLSKQYTQYYEKFQKQISILRVKLKDVAGDGNCLFRCFADQIDGNQVTHKFMRQQSCKYMLENQDFFKPFLDQDQDGNFDKYIKLMLKDGQWGGHLQIQALCECFKCIVIIHKLNLQQIIMRPMTQQPTFGIIHLGYFQHEDFQHYVSIRQMEDDSQQPAIEKLKFLNKNMYQHLLYEDQQMYMIQKQIQQLQIIQKFEEGDYENYQGKNQYKQAQQPYPGYPRNKKCKCGSKKQYKQCCFKEFQKNQSQKYK